MKHTLILEIQTTSPLHITALEPARYDPAKRGIVRGGGSDVGIPCSITRSLRVAHDSNPKDDEGNVLESGMRFTSVPVIPANTLGGKLRTMACELIEDAVIDRGMCLSANAFNVLRKGTATADFRRNEQTIALGQYGARHPLIGIFGGTSFGIDANLVVHEGLPVTTHTKPYLAFEPRVVVPITDWNLTDALAIVRKDALLDAEPDRLISLVGENVVNDYRENEMAAGLGKKARKAEGDSTGKKTALRAVAAYEAVRIGVPFQLTVELRSRTPEQLGLLLLAVKRLIDDGQIGGKRARGCGRFVVRNARLLTHAVDGSGVTDSGIFGLRTEGGAYPFAANAETRAAIAAAETWIESVDVRELEALCASDAPTAITPYLPKPTASDKAPREA